MLNPNVVLSSGLRTVLKKWVSVLAVGCGLAPPTATDIGWMAESGAAIGPVAPPAPGGATRNGMAMATPAARASFPADGRIIRSPPNGDTLRCVPDPYGDPDGRPCRRDMANVFSPPVTSPAARPCGAAGIGAGVKR